MKPDLFITGEPHVADNDRLRDPQIEAYAVLAEHDFDDDRVAAISG